MGLAQAAALRPDAIILDLGLPDNDGLEILKRLRDWSHAPVIVLSVRDADTDKIALLDAGAEYALLRLFIQHAGKVLTHTQILREVWGPAYRAGGGVSTIGD